MSYTVRMTSWSRPPPRVLQELNVLGAMLANVEMNVKREGDSRRSASGKPVTLVAMREQNLEGGEKRGRRLNPLPCRQKKLSDPIV